MKKTKPYDLSLLSEDSHRQAEWFTEFPATRRHQTCKKCNLSGDRIRLTPIGPYCLKHYLRVSSCGVIDPASDKACGRPATDKILHKTSEGKKRIYICREHLCPTLSSKEEIFERIAASKSVNSAGFDDV